MIHAPDHQFDPNTKAALDEITGETYATVRRQAALPVGFPSDTSAITTLILGKSLLVFVRDDTRVSAEYEIAKAVLGSKRSANQFCKKLGAPKTQGRWKQRHVDLEELAISVATAQEQRGRTVSAVVGSFPVESDMTVVLKKRHGEGKYYVCNAHKSPPGWYVEILAGEINNYDKLFPDVHHLLGREMVMPLDEFSHRYTFAESNAIYGMLVL